ncbi:MAG: carboxypeptidase regulatory-like domain-containing protein [Vicinamibacterales bacterium]
MTATSPALIGSRTAVSESDGRFLIANLPSGVYGVRFELQGFQTVLRENIRLTQGATLTVDIDLPVATLAESITVTAESPIVDTTTTKVGAEFNAEVLYNVPSATDLWASLAQTPGVRMRGYDVGGSHKSQQNGYEAFGIRGQNKVMFEGIDTTEGDNAAFFYSQYFAVDEVAITAVGGDVEMSSPGTAIVQTYKSGGNRFSGIESLTYEGESFVSDNTNDELSARAFTGNPNLLFYEVHFDLGGPILKDKLWFYGAYNYFKLDKALSGVPREVATDPVTIEDPLLKVTWKAAGNDTLSFFYQPRNYKKKPNRNLSAATAPESVLGQASKTWIKKAAWSRVWSNRLFMDVRAAACCEIWPMVTRVDAATNPARQDTSTQLITGAGWDAFTLDYQKPQASTTWTYFLPDKKGSHDMKFGFEWIENRYQQGINGQSGQIRYLDLNGAVDRVLINDTGRFDEFGSSWNPSFTSNRMISAFLQDRWSPTRNVTIQAGLRFGHQRPSFEEGSRNPVRSELFPQITVPEQVLFTRNNVAPRLGLVWDLLGTGRTALKASYGRYYAIYANNFNTANPGGVNSRTFRFLDQNGNRLYDGLAELGAQTAATGGANTTVDPDLKSPYADEYSASIEHQFWGEASARAVYVRKMTRNVFGLVNEAWLGAVTVPIQRPNPLAAGAFINALDIPNELRGVVRNRFMNIPDSDANYDSISLSAQKRFGGGLFV